MPFNLEDIKPFKLFRPRPGENVTSLVRLIFGEASTTEAAQRFQAVALAVFSNQQALSILDGQGQQAFNTRPDPLEHFAAHAILETPCIAVERYPDEGQGMEPELTEELIMLYEELFQLCSMKTVD
ncbi:hypothetical protein CRD60_08015 [Bifidobacterium aemilianum]|uniref:Uncharacterized protein n=1 Tax=Bifidobacterium aemilianum TaxID=2493120 RepID=A0A366K638_9BIFI|nr:hypothetical protein [Bifidobacterium aemilianum]RBP97205.1 hypothetical protein CRD60_08015 [Bifidobacterium aemilianum]